MSSLGHMRKRRLVVLNVLGGIAVLGSYVHGLGAHPDTAGQVWGGVPMALRPLYTVSMLAAAAGYFPLTWYFLWRIDGARPGYRAVTALYALVLVPSALWMPLTFRMLAAPGPGLWALIRLDLALVGVGAVGLTVALWLQAPRREGVAFWLAVAGALAFCFQTAVLDALVWPAYFPA